MRMGLFTFFKKGEGKFWTVWKSAYHNSGRLVDSPPTIYRSDRWPNVLSYILTTTQSLLTSNVTRLSSNEHIWPIWPILGEIRRFITILDPLWIVMINITIFWEWNMSNCVSLHEETEFRSDRYHSLVCTVSFCSWSASSRFSWTPSRMTIWIVFEAKFDLEDSRPCSRHLSAPIHHPGPFEHIKFRIFIIALPRSSKSWFFGILKLKGTGVVTNPF